MIRKLTKQEVPDGSLLGWISDVHVPIHHPAALRLACEAFEWAGVTHFVAAGDILDVHCLSSHDKDPDRILEQGTLLEEVEPGRWFLDYLATRPCYMPLGNHEGRVDRWIAENPSLFGNSAVAIQSLARIPHGIEVLTVGSELRLGNLVLAHGDAEFKRSTGGKYPAQRLLDMAPDQSTIVGHLHRISSARRTSRDEDGIPRTRAAWTMGHMSVEERHYGYVSKHPNWQLGFGLIRVWWEGERPRWNVYQVEVLFDRKGRPYFELFGRVFQ